MKKLFLLLLVMNINFAGRELYSFDAQQKLFEIKNRLLQIRTHLGYRLTMDDFVRLSEQERNEQYEKFDQLWDEFIKIKPLLKKQLCSDDEKKALVIMAILLRKDKERYERERTDNNLARMVARVTLAQNENEELTQ